MSKHILNKRLCRAYKHCYENNKQKSLQSIRNRLILENLDLVTVLAKSYLKSANNITVELNDLVNDGLMGLENAARKYKPETNLAYTTYAKFWILKKIRESLMRANFHIHVPSNVHLAATRLNKESQRSSSDISNEDAVRWGFICRHPNNWDSSLPFNVSFFNTNVSYFEDLVDTSDDGAQLNHAQISSSLLVDGQDKPIDQDNVKEYLLSKCADTLTTKEFDVITEKYFSNNQNNTLNLIASKLNIKQNHVSKAHARAITKLKQALHEERHLLEVFS